MPAADRQRVIIHAGFQKTGTTTVQRALSLNRPTLCDYRIILKTDMPRMCQAALT